MKIKYKPDQKEYFLVSLQTGSKNKYLLIPFLGLFLYFFLTLSRPEIIGTFDLFFREIFIFCLSLFFSITSYLLSLLLYAITLIFRIRSFKSTFQQEIEYIFNNDGIITKYPLSSKKSDWNLITSVKETKYIFIINTKEINTPLWYIPKRAFIDKKGIDQFKDLLRLKNLMG